MLFLPQVYFLRHHQHKPIQVLLNLFVLNLHTGMGHQQDMDFDTHTQHVVCYIQGFYVLTYTSMVFQEGPLYKWSYIYVKQNFF